MENYMQILNVSMITLSVYAIIYALRKATNENETFKRFIPLIALCLGAVLGGITCLYAPELVQTSNVLTSILLGAVSGLASTGRNQIFKQLGKKRMNRIKMIQNTKLN